MSVNPPSLTLPPQALDQPLPTALTGSGHGWVTGYRRYPVFSAPWARGRAQVFGGAALLALLLTLLPLLVNEGLGKLPLGGFAQIAVQLFVPLLLGPWLGCWIRGQAWPEVHERAALVAMVVALVLGLLAFHQFGAEPLKQRVA